VSEAAVAPPWPDLPEKLVWQGEFGAELVLFLPFVTWLSAAGLLRGRRISTYRGMRCFYEHLDCAGIETRAEQRRPAQRLMPGWLPARDEHALTRNPFMLYPDLRTRFRSLPLDPALEEGAPLLVLHNKYNEEWGRGPVNFIDTDTLDALFGMLKRDFRLVYVRHGLHPLPPGFSQDRNRLLDFADAEVLRDHPEVLAFDDLFAAHRASGQTNSVNAFKNALYARCHRFITVQGGGAHHIAMFRGSLMVVLHRQGMETRLAYGDEGYYSFMANPAPIRAICRRTEDLPRAAGAFSGSRVVEDRLLPDASQDALLAAFSTARAVKPRPLAGGKPGPVTGGKSPAIAGGEA